ncbi:AI-2E family transporter [Streptacidiphilus jiangxiensis]|uniref:Predicted PurR-regulated permease PerM n=1 Tax=Streptacidiphilus jiangxiensis TaxID=235985 RepID=A0A1H7QTQ3_STRJI|nr:AI-2E family transporter [Streptacidiphilus jiangxiensis]SEL51336.1 Predicted PurR-regulated permease PerM [Streptacidiphilus jiangxiensis]
MTRPSVRASPRRRATATRHAIRGPRPTRALDAESTPARQRIPLGLQVAAGWAWRLLVLGTLAYVLYRLLARFQPVAIAVFLGLVVAAVLRPLADRLNQFMPRPLAVVAAYVLCLLFIAGAGALTGFLVAGESGHVATQFDSGVDRLKVWLEGRPFHVHPSALTDLQHKVSSFVSSHRSTLIQNAVSGATQVVEALTVAALGLFCSVFFVHSGERMWSWTRDQLPASGRVRWDRAGRAAWRTFAGYIRGIILVAATNAILVGIALFVLRVPFALPLAVLEFLAAFVPLIGSPFALAVASVVALAARGPVTALIVLALIVVIGQIEGHLLHPLIMSWAVSLHPVVVAVSVITGTLALGFVGAVIAVPAVSVAWAVIQALREPVLP